MTGKGINETGKPLKDMARKRIEAEKAAYRTIMQSFRSRIIGGLAITLPIAITYAIITWMYGILKTSIIQPTSWLLEHLVWVDTPQPDWYRNYLAPIVVITFALVILYFLGLFVRSRLHRAIDWVMLHVPVVTTVYGAVRNMLSGFSDPDRSAEPKRHQRAVLVEFPHPGTRVPGFVTARCLDSKTGQTILAVYVPTTPIPTTGFILLVPEQNVYELNWSFEETLQTVVSGGLSTPKYVSFSQPLLATSVRSAAPVA